MENRKLIDLEIGKEQPPMVAGKVKVLDLRQEPVKFEKDTKEKLVLKVKHSNGKDLEISQVKFEKNKKLTTSGLWLVLDQDGNLPHNSAVAHFLRHYGVKSPKQLIGMEIDTASDEGGYLIVKAY